MGRTACTEPQCLYSGELYLYLYLCSPMGRTACTEPQCLYTTVHFTFTYTSTPPMGRMACTEPQCLYNGALYLYLYLYSPYGPHGLYRASVPVQRCTLPLPIPLLPLWTVRPVQSLSACTTVHFTFTYTSSPLMGRTACTEPQCLYKGALYLTFYHICALLEFRYN